MARILVVDDDPDVREVIEVSLVDHACIFAGDGEEALRQLEDHNVDVVILDVMMPEVDGWEVARQLAEDGATSRIPVVLLTARTQREDVERGTGLRVAAYVTKPFDPSELVDTIRRLGSARS